LEKQAANPELGIEEAFTIALELESSEISAIYKYLTTPLHKSPYLLRRKIATCLPEHVTEMLEAARKFGLKNGTFKELTRLSNSSRDERKARNVFDPPSDLLP
jgi:hypothetical protein